MLFCRWGTYAAVTAKGVVPRNLTADGILPQIKTIRSPCGPVARGWDQRSKAAFVNAVHSDAMGLEAAAMSCRSKSFSPGSTRSSHGVAGLRNSTAPAARLAQRRR